MFSKKVIILSILSFFIFAAYTINAENVNTNDETTNTVIQMDSTQNAKTDSTMMNGNMMSMMKKCMKMMKKMSKMHGKKGMMKGGMMGNGKGMVKGKMMGSKGMMSNMHSAQDSTGTSVKGNKGGCGMMGGMHKGTKTETKDDK